MYNFDFEENDKWQKGLDLTHAVWRISDASLENQRLKKDIKKISSDIFIRYTNHLSENEENEREIILSINSLIALLSLAQRLSSLKEINFLILKNEYKKIKFNLTAKIENRKISKQITDNFKKQKNDLKSNSFDFKKEESKLKIKNNKEKILPKKEFVASKTSINKSIDAEYILSTLKILNERQVRIYDFFKERKKEKIKLKDLKSLFPEKTDRTIRNDLKKLYEKKLIDRSNGKGQASFYYLP